MATIKLYEWFVLTAVLLCELSSVTSEVYSVRSWGDPHITTVDRVVYDFNGHGEYIFLQTGNTTVQVRTDFVTPGNKDSTIFVAVAIKDDIGLFEAQLNRTSGVVTVFKDGMVVCSSNDSPPQGGPSNTMFPCGFSSTPPRPVRWILVGNGKVLFSLKGFGSYLKMLALQGGSEISISLDGIKDSILHSNLTGLAGSSVNIKAKNGTLFRVSNLLDMFDFGESLRISENESLFNYSLSSGNYSTYNTFSRPTFYDDYLTNLTALFNLNGHQHNDSDIDEFDKTCNESKVRDECLLAIARSDDIAAGEVVNINYRHEQYLYYWRHVNECLNTSYVDQCTTHGGVCQNLHGSWNCTCPLDTLWMDVGTEETPIYRCQKNHTYVGNVTFVSIFNITEDYIRDFVTKKLTTALSNSTMNGSTDPPLTVKQLFVSSTITKINWKHESHSEFYEVMFTLRFGLPMATRTLQDILSSLPTRDGDIYDMHFVVFNESENEICDFPNECEPFSTICRTENGTVECTCKDGFIKSSSPTICLDIDECTGVNQCRDGTCINTIGSYKCNCHDGYHHDGNDNITCLDVDECDSKYDDDDKCDVNSNCTNTDGSFTCMCHPGYRLMSNGYQCEGMRVEDAVTVRCNDFRWDVRVNMNTLRQLVPDAKASDIYMGDNSCTGQETWNGYLHFNQELSECESYESIQHGENVYSNQLIYSEHDPIHPFIIRRFKWTISLTCTMNRNKTTSGHLHNDHLPLDVSLHSVQGGDQNDVNMTFFRDPQFSQQIESVPLHVSVGDEVYVKVFTMTSHKIRVHTCYTQPSMDSLDPLRYTLISNGCEVDPSTHILSQTIRETRFVFTEFEYTTNHEGLFVFCDVTFCNMNDSSDQCSQKCVR